MNLEKLVFGLFLLLIACASDKEDNIAPVDTTPSEFSTYIERFKAEAKARNFNVDLSSLEIKFVDETDPPGFCGYGTSNPPVVQIRKVENSIMCWGGFK